MIVRDVSINSIDSRCNYSATSNNMKLVHWPLISGLFHLVQRGADWAGPQPPPRPLFAVLNVTTHPLMASVPITVWSVALRFNVPIRVKLHQWDTVGGTLMSSRDV